MEKRDYYEVLGVSRESSDEDLKKAYRKLAMKHHPDRTQGDKESEEKFKELSEAYAVLSDSQKRANYDQFGHAAAGGGFSGFQDFGGFGDVFGDIFEDFFGGGQTRQRSQGRHGDDIAYSFEMTLEEAFEGLEREISVPRKESCEECSGTGLAPGASRNTCPTCRGAGRVRQSQGFFSITRACHHCQGSGSVIENPCKSCKGEGRSRSVRKLNITIPPGVDSGSRLRYRGEGEAGMQGGQRGDLYIVVNVAEHELFEREGDDLLCALPISFSQAALGTQREIPTLDGGVNLKIPAGTQSHKVFRVRGRGMPNLRRTHARGDLYIRVVIETPKKLNDQQRELLEEFARISGDEVHPLSRNFFDKVKDAFGV